MRQRRATSTGIMPGCIVALTIRRFWSAMTSAATARHQVASSQGGRQTAVARRRRLSDVRLHRHLCHDGILVRIAVIRVWDATREGCHALVASDAAEEWSKV